MRRACSHLLIPALAALAAFAPARGYSQVGSGSIVGHVTGSVGAALAGITVSVTSPALQMTSVQTATDDRGTYRFLHLPAPGVYTVTLEGKGYLTQSRVGLQLQAGFEMRLDVVMHRGSLSETVTVSGATPVLDPVDTSTNTVLQSQEMEDAPLGAGLQEVLPMAAGLSLVGTPDVGDSNLANRAETVTDGALLEPTIDVEGIDVTTNHDLDTAVYVDTYGLAEVQVSASGNNANVGFPGAWVAAQLKSGANRFHGSVAGSYESPDFQSSNVTPALAAQGVTVSNPLRSYYDVAGDLGGRIVPKKLWFYTGASRQAIRQGLFGFVSGPNASGCWTCLDAPQASVDTSLWESNLKLSWQPDSATRLVAAWIHSEKFLNAFPASSTVPLPSSLIEHQGIEVWKLEIDKTLSHRMFLEAVGGFGGYDAHYRTQPGSDVRGHPSSEELTTDLFTGPAPGPSNRPQGRYETHGDISYSRGSHLVRLGGDFTWEEGATRVTQNEAGGDYLLLFDQGQPSEIQLFNYPVTPVNLLHSQALFATDSWKLARVALNLGVRWERYRSFYPAENKPGGPFSSASVFPSRSLLTWEDVVPRIGAAWDWFGDGRTLLKGSFGIFGDTMGDLWANLFNPDAQVTTSYTWNGPCVATGFDNVSWNNTSCDVSPATLAGLNPASPAFISAVGGLNELNNPDLREDKTWEYAGRLERQLVPDTSLSIGYLAHRVYDLYSSQEPTTDSTADGIQILRPYSVYTIPGMFTDSLTGSRVTIYTFAPAWAAPRFNEFEIVNAPHGRPDTFQTVSIAVNKRYSKRWNLLGSFWLTKNHEWIQAIQPTPNDIQFPVDNTWNWEARASAWWFLPWGLQLNGFYRAESGVPGQRTETFSSPLLLQGPVKLRMQPFGAQRGPVVALTNLRAEKVTGLTDTVSLDVSAALYNVFNTSAATSTSYLTGPTYRQTTGIVSPRVGRVGLELHF
ncbi:MAG TPA: carboxypeptidase regulatory-like domain-containing protein [Acidobacteriaceae bacterium]|nr:carboxypeptidase regulatory-like domain-containing protein [Acidobacteriaceae bacterium]